MLCIAIRWGNSKGDVTRWLSITYGTFEGDVTHSIGTPGGDVTLGIISISFGTSKGVSAIGFLLALEI